MVSLFLKSHVCTYIFAIDTIVTSNSPCVGNVCEQICLTLPPGNIHTCACSTGLKLRDNNISCQACKFHMV